VDASEAYGGGGYEGERGGGSRSGDEGERGASPELPSLRLVKWQVC
jgi:hypothetical protein